MKTITLHLCPIAAAIVARALTTAANATDTMLASPATVAEFGAEYCEERRIENEHRRAIAELVVRSINGPPPQTQQATDPLFMMKAPAVSQ